MLSSILKLQLRLYVPYLFSFYMNPQNISTKRKSKRKPRKLLDLGSTPTPTTHTPSRNPKNPNSYYYNKNQPAGASPSVPFETIDRGASSGIQDPLQAVYRNEEDFRSFWADHTSNAFPPPKAPDVNFNANMVVAVFWGTKSLGGYSPGVTSIE